MKKQNQISDISDNLSKFNLANLFNVYSEKVNNVSQYYYNIMKSLTFSGLNNIPRAYYTDYQVQEEDTWPSISWKFFDTIELWWLICSFNKISNPIDEPSVGSIIKVPNEQILNIVLNSLRND